MTKQQLIEWVKDNKGKAIAMLISCFYLIVALLIGEWLRMAIFLIFPLACIFFSDAMGGYTGMSRLGPGPRITGTTPGYLVAFGGWLLLLFPLAIAVFKAIFK